MAPSIPTLLGPPEIHQDSAAATSTSTSTTNSTASSPPSDAFVDHIVANFNSASIRYKNPRMGLTENCSPTYMETGNPCLDFFFHIVPDTPRETLKYRLQLTWDHDPLKALKLVANLRGVRGTGKSDKEGFYTAALWLHKNHPKTLARNAASFAEFGYFKDLLEILFRLLEGPDARRLEKVNWERKKSMVRTWEMRRRGRQGFNRRKYYKSGDSKLSREEKKIEKARRVLQKFNSDPDFKFLHECISDVFARFLRLDLKLLNSGDSGKISLAAKWCPSLDSSFDRLTLLCEPIAKKVFPREEFAEYEGVEEAHYAYRVRDRLRKEVLVPLRKALELPEVFMGVNDWGSIPYNRVASVAMKLYTRKFFEHDWERFSEYLSKVESGEAKIAAGALLPHEIIQALYDPNDEGAGRVAELQWKRMVDDVSKKGKLNNCLAICDVSGSMSGTPMEVSVALGILVSEMSEQPWKGKIISFSENPELQMVQGESLKEKMEFVERMEWGMNTDFQKVFDLILEVAVEGKLKGDEMVKRLFVFSDMEFDMASANPWEMDYEAIVRKFKEKGYGDCVPEIVFWNLRDSRATPVPGNQTGVALVSGFSKNLMTMFLDEGGIMDPEAVMDAAIAGEEYQKLVVVN